MNARPDSFGARAELDTPSGPCHIYRLDRLASRLGVSLERLPFSIRIVLEAALRTCDGYQVTDADVERIARWTPQPPDQEVPFKPARVILQDFTGVPCVVDLAAMRDAMRRLGGDPRRINPLVPVDLVIDHSVQVDVFGNVVALERNAEIEFERNRERYEFLRWGQKAFSNFRVVPPATGIVHQVNLEFLAQGVLTAPQDGGRVAYPDTLVGTDSHTTMINGLGVLGWGVGGIEAEAVMLGQPLYLVLPQVVGFRLTGSLRDGVTATDLVLTVTQMLRRKGVVDKFVEFCGPGLSTMSLPDRATIANMSPEFGATVGFFPVDDETLRYFERTGRGEAARLVEAYYKEQGLFRSDATLEPSFSDTLALDLGEVEPSLAGPKRPQDRVKLKEMKSAFRKTLTAPVKDRGYGLAEAEVSRAATVGDGVASQIGHGAVVIAAITSCTNTSNPSVMVGAGLLAKKAAERGMQVKPYVKTSMAPGSKVVTEYLRQGGLLAHLEALGFNVVGYGCTTCIAAGTPVLMADGTARPIEALPEGGAARLLAPDESRRLALAAQTRAIDQGERDCVSIVLQDGRTLVCTPDHELLRSDGRWVRADELKLESDRLVIGLEAPLDTPGADEAGYVLDLGELVFAMQGGERRLQALAFARLLGHLIGDGSISAANQGRLSVDQAIDREAVLDDVERVTGQRPAGARHDGDKWSIPLPYELTAAIAAMPGVAGGQRIPQLPALPAFVLDPRCPKAVVREFLGGLFGAAGGAPLVHRQGPRGDDVALGTPTYSQTAKPEQVPQLRDMMGEIVRLLARCGAGTEGFQLYEYSTVSGTEVRLVLPEGLSFVERVGYRYSVDKALRASAAAVYWRTVSGVHEQKLWMSERTNARTTEQDVMDFWDSGEDLTTEVVEPWVSPEALYREIGASFALDSDALTAPTMALRVIDRQPAGRRRVHDLSVAGVHAFVAGTVAVHNCIGNSGPLPEDISQAIADNKLVAAAVLSGNRNFEGRVNPHTRANYLASPPLVVAYALAGTVDIDMESEPLGKDRDGQPVFLRDLWPSQREIADTIAEALQPAMFNKSYGNVFDGNPKWNAIPVGEGELYPWDEASTYIHEPPFFQDLTVLPAPVADLHGARVLVMVGDSVTTDHISPAGDIAEKSPAGEWLKSRGIQKKDFNSYGSRRGNDLVMVRGTFANIRLKNLLLPGTEGNITVHLPSGEQMSVFDASQRYTQNGVPLVVLAGKEYGSGSSRDWAAKGTLLLGVKAVLAESYERIHRSNLVGMGVLPLQYEAGQSADSLGLGGRETFSVTGMAAGLTPRQKVTVEAVREDGSKLTFHAIARLDTPVEVDYYRNGGILPTVLRAMAKKTK